MTTLNQRGLPPILRFPQRFGQFLACWRVKKTRHLCHISPEVNSFPLCSTNGNSGPTLKTVDKHLASSKTYHSALKFGRFSLRACGAPSGFQPPWGWHILRSFFLIWFFFHHCILGFGTPQPQLMPTNQKKIQWMKFPLKNIWDVRNLGSLNSDQLRSHPCGKLVVLDTSCEETSKRKWSSNTYVLWYSSCRKLTGSFREFTCPILSAPK